MAKRDELDVCVIGTGAGGGVMIQELTAGHHLGGYSPEQMMGKAKIKTAWGEEV